MAALSALCCALLHNFKGIGFRAVSFTFEDLILLNDSLIQIPAARPSQIASKLRLTCEYIRLIKVAAPALSFKKHIL
jgi:hypothetical protein